MSSGVCQAPIILSRVRDNSCSCIENFLKFIHHELRGTRQKTAAVVNSTKDECLNQSSNGVLVERPSHTLAGVAGRSTEHRRLRHAFVVTNLLKLKHQEDEHCQWE